MLWLLNFLRGWVFIEVRGAYIERFFNLCAENRIEFWGMKRISFDCIQVCVTVSNFRRLPKYARRAMCKVHILSKHGLRFFTVKFRKRIAFVTGLIAFIFIAWIMTNFIWVIDIPSVEGIDEKVLSKCLEENGVYIGAHVSDVNIESLKNNILISMPELSYVGVNIKGSRAYVNIRKRVFAPELESENEEICNIVAKRGGIITSVVVQKGTPEVQPGDTVIPGQLLASCYMTGRSGTTVITRAKAEIHARTWYTVASVVPIKYEYKQYTASEKRRYSLLLLGNRLNLYGNSRIPYEKCDKIIKTTFLTFPGGIKLPIGIEKQTLREYRVSQHTLPPEKALSKLSEKMEVFEIGEGVKVLDRRYTASVNDKLARVDMVAECEEEIGVEQKIPKGE